MTRLSNIIDKANEKIGRMLSFLIFPMIAVVIYDVVMRYVFKAPTTWGFEVALFIFGTYAVFSGAYALLHGAHPNVDVVYRMFSPRVRAIVDIFTSTFFFLFIIVLLWQGARFFGHSLSVRETSMSLWDPPLYPVKLMITLGVLPLLLQGIAKLAKDFITAIRGSSNEY